MSTPATPLLYRNAAFGWLAAATALLLTVPAVATAYNEANWTASDFAVMAVLALGMGSLFILAARKLPAKYRLLTAVVCLGVFLLIWAELAVGVLTRLGS